MKSPSVLEAAAKAHLTGRNTFLDMWTMDVAERMKIRRKAIARDSGLDESYDVGPAYPQQGPSIVNVSSGGGLIKGALLSSLLLAGGGGGALGAASLLGMFGGTTPAAATVPAPAPQEWEVTVESVDGDPVITNAKPVDNK